MNSRGFLSVFVRSISRSCIRDRTMKRNEFEATDKLKLGPKVVVPVEKDTQRLANYVCGTNLFSEGGEDIKLKPDSEYPEWLWKIGPPLPLEKLDQNTKTYWNRVMKLRKKEIVFLNSLQRNKTVHK